MKKLLSLFVITVITTTVLSVHAQEISWLTLKSALLKNQQEKKMIFVDVYTDWCGWCKRMEQSTFLDKDVVNTLKKDFISAKFNAEGSDTIVHGGKTYLNDNPGKKMYPHNFTYVLIGSRPAYPSFAVLDEQNSVVGVIQGYQTSEALINALNFYSSKSYLKETYEQYLQRISKKE